MLDTLIREAADRYGLGDKSKDLVSMVLAYVTDPAKGGLAGLLDRFRSAGLGDMAQSWLGNTGVPQAPTKDQVESMFGSSGGLLSALTDKLNLPRSTITSAVGGLLPMLISRLTPGGTVPSVLPAEVTSLISSGKSMLGGLMAGGAAVAGAGAAAASSAASSVGNAASQTAAAAGGGIGKWLPWIIGALLVIFGISYCGKKTPDAAPAPAASAPAPAPAPAPEPAPAPAPAPEPAPAAAAPASAVPVGAAVLDSLVQDVPKLQVFFDTGKVDVPAEFADKSKGLVAYLQSHADQKAVISGFNDPTGDPAKNAELSKQRAMAVQAALVLAGVPSERTALEKPADSTDSADTNAAARRVDVMLRAN